MGLGAKAQQIIGDRWADAVDVDQFRVGIPIAALTAILTGLICRAIGMDARAAKPVILLSALGGFLLGATVPYVLPHLLTP